MIDSEEDDAHFCLRCKGTFIGLDVYVEHRKEKCKRGGNQALSNREHRLSKDSSSAGEPLEGGKQDLPQESDGSNPRSWPLEGLQNSSSSTKEYPRLEDTLQPDLLDMNRKDEMLDTFLPPHDNDPDLKAADFFSILELQSSKNPIFQDISSSHKNQAGMLTRSKCSAVLQAKKNRESFLSKPTTADYPYETYQGEHSQYVVGKDVVITDNYDYRREVVGTFKEKKPSGLDSPKSKTRSDCRILEDDGKSDSHFLFQEVHNEVTISSEGKAHEESDSYSDESEDDDEDEEYESPRISMGGKWKPGVNEWVTTSNWSSAPPAGHTGGKWKPSPPPIVPAPAYSMPSTSSAQPFEQDTALESSKWRVPSPSHTRGKWLPSIDSPVRGSKVHYWCGPCNRRLSSLILYERHCQSDLHHKRTRQENQLDEDLSMENQRATGKREVKRTQTYINSDLWSKSKRKRLRQATTTSTTSSLSAGTKRPRSRALVCSVCQCRVWPHLIGKHLVSHFHSRRARAAPELAALVAFQHMDSIVLQAPFQCAVCRFYCNTTQTLLNHWISADHALRDSQTEGRYCCSFCRVECSSSPAMHQHLMSEKHKESVAIINGSVPIVIQKKIILQCNVCEKQFRYNKELGQHSKSTGHSLESTTASNKYQERERCSQCSFMAFSRISLQRHLTHAHGDAEGKFFCTCCDVTFDSAADAKLHRTSDEHKLMVLTKQNNDKELAKVCCHCYSVFTGLAELKKHLKQEHPEMAYRCIRCGACFTLKQGLARHVRVGGCTSTMPAAETDGTRDGPYMCCECAFSSSSKAELLFHLALHEKPTEEDPPRYRCIACSRVFLKSSLKKHLLSHTGERPYSCRVCGSSFARKDVLESHVLTVHSVKRAGDSAWQAHPERQRTETCPDCGAAFFDRSTLQQHRQIHDGKQFKCDQPGCVYAGRSKGDLKLHSLSHGDQRPFRCGDCGFATKTKAQLVRHGRVHLDTKTHSCPHCQFTCNSSTHLNRHLRLHTGAKPYHCPHCKFSCNLLENLRKHVLSTKKHPGRSLYTCPEDGCSFNTNFAKDYRTHLVVNHGRSASAAASYVAGLYRGAEEDPRHVDQPLAINAKRKRRKPPQQSKEVQEDDPMLESHPKTLSDNPTLASAVIPRNSSDTARSDDLLRTVIISEPSDDVICIQLPADDGLDGYDGASFFAHGDAFTDMGQRVLFEGLQRHRTISLGESAVMMPLEAEDLEGHEGLIVIDEVGVEHSHGV